MKEIYFKQMPHTYSAEFESERIEIFSFDRIANTVTGVVMDDLIECQGWTQAEAITFMESRALRFGLDQTLGDALEIAARNWAKREAPDWKQLCKKWTQEKELAA